MGNVWVVSYNASATIADAYDFWPDASTAITFPHILFTLHVCQERIDLLIPLGIVKSVVLTVALFRQLRVPKDAAPLL